MAKLYHLVWLFPAITYCYTKVTPKWDYFVLTLQWPQSVCNEGIQEKNVTCRIPPHIDYWTIHGLWPQGLNSKPQCPKTPPFDSRAIKDLLPELNRYWPDIFLEASNPFWLWQHEWQTHGTCASSLPATRTENLYFKKGLELRQKYNNLSGYDSQYILSDSHRRIYNMRDWDSPQVPALAYDSLVLPVPQIVCANTDWSLANAQACLSLGCLTISTLNDCGIRPSASKPYRKQDFRDCYKRKFPVSVSVRCFKHEKANRYELVETRICLAKNFNLISCKKEGRLEEINPHKRRGSVICPDTGIYYPPIKT